MSAMSGEAVLFHGFVSSESLMPLPGMTVSLVRSTADSGAVLTATTETDGYFSVPRLGKGDEAKRAPDAAGTGAAASSAAAGERIVNVEIADGTGRIVYRDPVPLRVDGTAYREYTIREV